MHQSGEWSRTILSCAARSFGNAFFFICVLCSPCCCANTLITKERKDSQLCAKVSLNVLCFLVQASSSKLCMSQMRTARWIRPSVRQVTYRNIRATWRCAVSWPSAKSSTHTGEYWATFIPICPRPVKNYSIKLWSMQRHLFSISDVTITHHTAIFPVKQCTEIGRKNLQRNNSGPVSWKLAFITEDLNHD